jgi:hypothetical protein
MRSCRKWMSIFARIERNRGEWRQNGDKVSPGNQVFMSSPKRWLHTLCVTITQFLFAAVLLAIRIRCVPSFSPNIEGAYIESVDIGPKTGFSLISSVEQS